MVRINLIDPACLADQHLVAEYDEILMLLGYVRRYPLPKNIPSQYTLGKGHMLFFKNKLLYLKERHELLKQEMRKRNFKPTKTIHLEEFPKELHHNYIPTVEAIHIIKKRLKEKLQLKPEYYRYYSKYEPTDFFLELLT